MGDFFQERYEKKIARSDVVLKKKIRPILLLKHIFPNAFCIGN